VKLRGNTRMTPKRRLFLGATLGFLLQVLAFVLNIPEAQIRAAFAFNASVLYFLPGVGVIVAVWVPPLLRGAYYYFLPEMASKRRASVLSIVLLLHVVPAVWLGITDYTSLPSKYV
jgi:hypothetical protein